MSDDEKPLEKVGPGMYLDARDALHLDIPELLEHFGVVDTPHNRDVLARGAEDAFRREFPGVKVIKS